MRLRVNGAPVRRTVDGVRYLSRLAAGAGVVLLVTLIRLAGWPPRGHERVIERRYTHAPSAVERDSLAALAANGVVARWRGSVSPVALEVDPDPVGSSVRVAVAAPAGSRIRMSDALGLLDSATINAGGASLALQGATSPLNASVAGEELHTTYIHPPVKSVAVFGAAGWETRFLLEALDASAQPVAARIRVGPQTFVTQGHPLPLDTARHSVAVALGAVDGPTADQIRRFVRAGGGLVIAPGATGLGDLAPGQFGRAITPVASLSLPSIREQLVRRLIGRLRADATPLDGARTAARRVGAGRVVQVGDEDTWRLAMASDAGRAAHGQLWLKAIAIAGPRDVARPAPDDDVAPRAALVAALGLESPAMGTTLPPIDWTSVVAGLLFVTLVGEWAMRRISGKA